MQLTYSQIILLILLLAFLAWSIYRWLLPALAWRRLLRPRITLKRNTDRTPSGYNLPYQELTIYSGKKRLKGWLVNAPKGTRLRKAVLIFHDLNETMVDWLPAQQFLWQHGISSLVFDYRGFGNSEGPVDLASLPTDAASALRTFVGRVGLIPDKFVLGVGLGAGVMLTPVAEYPNFIQGAALINPYSSLTDAVPPQTLHRDVLLRRLPGAFNAPDDITRLKIPLLFVRTQPETTPDSNPFQEIFNTAGDPKQKHCTTLPEPLLGNQPESFLRPLVNFINGKSNHL